MATIRSRERGEGWTSRVVAASSFASSTADHYVETSQLTFNAYY